jgi:hypothetical protein
METEETLGDTFGTPPEARRSDHCMVTRCWDGGSLDD